MIELQPFDYITLLIYMLLMAGIGFFFKWFVKDLAAYTKGSNTIPWVAAGISNFMAMFSTFVFVAYAGIAYEHGLVSVTIFWSTIPACIVAAIFFAKRWRRAGVSTPIEYLETRFNHPVRQTIGWVGLIMRILDNMVRLYAIGIFLTAVTPLSLPACLIVSSIIIISFTLFGGIWAVSIMGTIQFVILIFTSLILFWLSLDHVGGFSTLINEVPDHLGWFNGPKGEFFWLFVYYLMIIIKYNENWIFIQRFYIVKDESSAKKVGYLSAFLFFIFPIIFMIPPIVSKMVFPDLPDSEMAYVAISSYLLPPGLMGIMIASMFAATMSSLNAEYNVIASVLSKDFYERLINKNASDKLLFRVAQLSTVLVGLIVLLGGLFIKDFGGAFEANKLFTGVFAIPVGIPLVLGIINKTATSRGAILTVVLGALSGIVLNSFPDLLSWEMATLIETIICLVIFFVFAWFDKASKESTAKVDGLFERLETAIVDKPKPDKKFTMALSYLYAISFAVAALLFIGLGLFHLDKLSGALSIASGMTCLLIGIALWIQNRGKEAIEELKEG